MTEPCSATDIAAVPLVFLRIAGRMWATELTCVREVVAAQRIDVMPNAVSMVEGLTNLRGDILPVIRTSSVLDGTDSVPSASRARDAGWVLVVAAKEFVVGLLVDTVYRVQFFPKEALASCGEGSRGGLSMDYVQWVLHRDRGEPVPVLDMARLIASLDARIGVRRSSLGRRWLVGGQQEGDA